MLSRSHQSGHFGPLKIAIGREALVRQGWSEIKPKRCHPGKFVASLMRQAVAGEPEGRTPAARVLVGPAEAPELGLAGLVPDYRHVVVSPLDVEMLWSLLASLVEPTTLGFAGTCQVPEVSPSLRAAQDAIATLYPDVIANALSFIGQEMMRVDYDVRNITPVYIQERAGKFAELEIERRTLKAIAKATSARDAKTPKAWRDGRGGEKDGWAAGGVVFGPEGSLKEKREVLLTWTEFELGDTASTLDPGEELPATLRDLCHTAGCDAKSLSSIWICHPLVELSGLMGNRLAETFDLRWDRFLFPQELWGWHPLAQAVRFLTAVAPGPRALISFDGRRSAKLCILAPGT